MLSTGKIRRVFPGGNTCNGFYSFYDNIISSGEANRIFCIKGGPGVGKSSFMKWVASEFLNLGCEVECHHCSSDPNSLDAVVIIPAKVAILDGTAPHINDPKNPGAVDEILNFGAYWNTEGLERVKDRIIELNNEKKSCYEGAYHYLLCAKTIQDDIEKLAEQAADKSKLSDLMLKLRAELVDNIAKTCGTARKRHLFHSALTSEGRVSFIETLICDTAECLLIEGDNLKGKSDILKFLAREFLLKGCDVEMFHQPLNPDRLETVLVKELNLILTTDSCIKEKAKRIIDLNQAMMPDKLMPVNEMIERDKEMIGMLEQEAVNRFKAAMSKHLEMEKLYTPQMDFDAMAGFRNDIIDRIKKYL